MQALAAVALILLALTLLGGCTRDKSWLTSPSAKALLGVTAPAVLAFDPPGEPPHPVPAPEGWRLTVDLARFGELENGTHALAILLDIESEPGAAMDLWLSRRPGASSRAGRAAPPRTIVATSASSSPSKVRMASMSLPLAGTTGHTLTVAFLDAEGGVILSSTRGIASFVPQLSGEPAAGSEVFRDLVACP